MGKSGLSLNIYIHIEVEVEYTYSGLSLNNIIYKEMMLIDTTKHICVQKLTLAFNSFPRIDCMLTQSRC